MVPRGVRPERLSTPSGTVSTEEPFGRPARLSNVRPIRAATLVSAALLASLVSPAAQASTNLPGRPNRDEIAFTVDRKGPNHIFLSDLQGRHSTLLVKG